MGTVETKMLRWTNENTQKDKIRYKEICLLASIDEKARESHLKWFGHVQRRTSNEPIRKSESIQVEGMIKGRERQKMTLVEVIKSNVN